MKDDASKKMQLAVMVVGVIVTAGGWVYAFGGGQSDVKNAIQTNVREIERLRQRLDEAKLPERIKSIETDLAWIRATLERLDRKP